jgi:hypothetical protein
MSHGLIKVPCQIFLRQQHTTAKPNYQYTKNKSLAMEQKIRGHHSGIRTANITIILNISIDKYFKKKVGVTKGWSD